jgi:hypothetical protein
MADGVSVGVGEAVNVMVGDKIRITVGDVVKGFAEVDNGIGVVEGNDVGSCPGAWVELMLASTKESEKAPRTRPIEISAIRKPRNTCRKFFIAISRLADPP